MAQSVIGAIIVGVAIVGAGVLVKTSVDRATTRLDAGFADAKQALQSLAQAGARAAATPPRSGPDPNRRYTISAAGAPSRGPLQARVKIFEFSDFQ
jgi:hypothetical protein